MSTPQTSRLPRPTADRHATMMAERDGAIRTLETQKADLSRTIERLQGERVFQNERIAGLEGQLKDAAALAASRQETLKGRNQEIQKLKEQHDADLRERLALAKQRDEARTERDNYKRSVDALTTQLDTALAERNGARAESAQKDEAIAEYQQALVDNDRAGQGGALILAAVVAVVTFCVAWLIRGWLR